MLTFMTESLGLESRSQRQILSPLGLMLTTAPLTIRPESSKLSPIKQSKTSSLKAKKNLSDISAKRYFFELTFPQNRVACLLLHQNQHPQWNVNEVIYSYPNQVLIS